jgi:hypothetical protein
VDERHLLVKLFTKANKESIDEGAVVDMITEFPKLIADCFDALAEDGDRGVMACR